MSEFRIWRREGGMTMLHGQHREVRYAVPSYFPQQPIPEHSFLVPLEVPILSAGAESATEGLPAAQWVPSGLMPAAAFLRLYVPEEEK